MEHLRSNSKHFINSTGSRDRGTLDLEDSNMTFAQFYHKIRRFCFLPQVRQLPLFLHAKLVLIPEIAEGRSVWADAPLTHFFNRFVQRLKMKPAKLVKD